MWPRHTNVTCLHAHAMYRLRRTHPTACACTTRVIPASSESSNSRSSRLLGTTWRCSASGSTANSAALCQRVTENNHSSGRRTIWHRSEISVLHILFFPCTLNPQNGSLTVLCQVHHRTIRPLFWSCTNVIQEPKLHVQNLAKMNIFWAGT